MRSLGANGGSGEFVQEGEICRFRGTIRLDAMKFVNSTVGPGLRLRGVNARILRPGTIRIGDVVRTCTPDA